MPCISCQASQLARTCVRWRRRARDSGGRHAGAPQAHQLRPRTTTPTQNMRATTPSNADIRPNLASPRRSQEHIHGRPVDRLRQHTSRVFSGSARTDSRQPIGRLASADWRMQLRQNADACLPATTCWYNGPLGRVTCAPRRLRACEHRPRSSTPTQVESPAESIAKKMASKQAPDHEALAANN